MAVRREILDKEKQLDILTREELLYKILKIETGLYLRNRALISFLYLTGMRVEECVKYIVARNMKRTVIEKDINGRRIRVSRPIERSILMGLPLKKKNLEFREDNILLVKNVRILKRKKKTFLKGGTLLARNIPIYIHAREQPFVNFIKDYISTIDYDDFLFNIRRERVLRILAKVRLFPHYLRHIRLTHLVVDYGYDVSYLKKFCGWRTAETAENYVRLNVEDLVERQRMFGRKTSRVWD